MVYAEIAFKIYAVDDNFGQYHLGDTLPTGVTIQCIFVEDKNYSFYVAMDDLGKVAWNNGGLVSGVSTVANISDVLDVESEYRIGEINSSVLAKTSSSGLGSLINNMRNEIDEWPFNTRYVGCLGEWMTVVNNLDIINQYLMEFGGNKISKAQYWTSTQINESKAWMYSNISSAFNPYDKVSNLYCRPFMSPYMNVPEV